MHYFSILLSLLIASVSASPVNTSPAIDIRTTTPAFMTVAQCKTSLSLKADLAKKPLFWSGCFGASMDACETADLPDAKYPQLSGYSVIKSILPKSTLPNYNKKFSKLTQAVKTSATNAFWSSCSQALATLAEGEVYMMLTTAADVLNNGVLDWTKGGARAGSTAELHEYPQLCANTAVTKLIHLSSADPTFSEDLTAKLLADRKAGCPKPGAIPTAS